MSPDCSHDTNDRQVETPPHQSPVDTNSLGPTRPWGRSLLVVAFSLVLLLVLSLWGLNRDRVAWLDTMGLYNPVYTFVHYHKMTYPVHGRFDRMEIHPPTHYLLVGWLMRFGIGLYYAVAIPFLSVSALLIFLIGRGRFPTYVKLGLMGGFFLTLICWNEPFDLRPDWQVALVWFTGLIALENARLDNWHLGKLGLGSFLLTSASGLHYFASAAFMGAAVYAGWALYQLGVRSARSKLLAILIGGCLFGIPYLVEFLIPNWKYVLAIVKAVENEKGLLDAFHRHFDIYAAMYQTASGGRFWVAPLTTLALEGPFRLHIPLFIVAFLGLAIFRSTRGLVFAGAPHVLFICCMYHKWGSYLTSEYLLYFAAFGVVTGTILDKLIHCVPAKAWRRTAAIASAFAITIVLIYQTPGLGKHDIVTAARFHELELARAAGREINHAGALVGAHDMLWYVTGTSIWCPAMSAADCLPFNCSDPEIIKRFWSRFDAIGDFGRGSELRGNQDHKGSFNWYLEGLFTLKGFYFGLSSPDLSYLLFSVKHVDKVIGYGLTDQGCYRFDGNPRGDYVFASLVGPADEAVDWVTAETLMSNVILLPNRSPTDVRYAILTMVLRRSALETARETVLEHAHVHDLIYGDLCTIDPALLVHRLAHEDQVIHFYRSVQEAVNERCRLP